ncbi:MAG: hypothetical protein RL754_346 [Bacteroidota bacterium]|jgi:integrase/recombinase XerD
MNWTDSINSYLEHLKFERGLSENTLIAYDRDLEQLAQFSENKGPRAIGPKEISGFLAHIHERGMSAKSQARILSALRGFYNWFVDEGHGDKNPAALFENPRMGRKLPVVLSTEEVLKLLDAVPLNEANGTRDRAILELLYACGLRVSEVVGLKRSLLRLKEGYIIVTGKGDKQRLVPIHKDAIKYLELYIEYERVHQKALPKFTDSVFLNNRGMELTRQSVFLKIKKAADSAGIKKNISPHTMRHSFATHLMERGADLRIVQQLLGHESITTTEIYTHISTQQLLDRVADLHPLNR